MFIVTARHDGALPQGYFNYLGKALHLTWLFYRSPGAANLKVSVQKEEMGDKEKTRPVFIVLLPRWTAIKFVSDLAILFSFLQFHSPKCFTKAMSSKRPQSPHYSLAVSPSDEAIGF